MTGGREECGTCGHTEGLAPNVGRIWAWLTRERQVLQCAHYELVQDALVDTEDRCTCADPWHLRGL